MKDLRVDEAPAPKENLPPQMPNDPAIVGVSAFLAPLLLLALLSPDVTSRLAGYHDEPFSDVKHIFLSELRKKPMLISPLPSF